MQQATRPLGDPNSKGGNIFAPPPASPRFVVNLCSSTTPVGLVQPSHAGLKRFTFFVSRRLEEGRERFRLHMGYFDSQEEAEKMLDLVRDVYPAAWAGVAPGIKLRARAAQQAAAAVAPPEAAPLAPESAAPRPAVSPVAPAASAPDVPAVAVAPAVPEQPAAPKAQPPAAPAAGMKLGLAPDLPRAQPAAPAVANSTTSDATRSLVDVRAAIDSLGDGAPATGGVLEGEAVLQLLTSARPAPAARVAPVLPSLPSKAPAHKPAPAETRAPKPAASRSATPPVRKPAPATSRPAANAEPALFAVQLLWSVQPIDMGQVPLLAIFSAYTLYGAEGNRDGRRWYGLRLGFFTDAVSAKQVAQYVRSEFSSVSVVPVSERERGRASAATAKPLPQQSQPADTAPELKFIDEVATDTAASGSQPALASPGAPMLRAADSPAAQAAIAAVGMGSRPTPGKRAKLRVAQGSKPVSKRPRPLSLEETLEILGAGDLSLEKGRGELMNDKAKRDRKPATPASSRFGRLINRLAERLGNG